jgi:hypothetical protein
MRGVYDLPLRGFIKEFQQGWHVLLVAEGDSRPTAHLGIDPDSGQPVVMGRDAGSLAKLSPAELERVMVREVNRNEQKFTVILAIAPEWLAQDGNPPVPFWMETSAGQTGFCQAPDPPTEEKMWLQRHPEWLLLGLWGVLVLGFIVLYFITRGVA